MIEDRTKMLAATISKLLHREAKTNIQKIFLKTHAADIAAVLETFSPEESLRLLNYVYSFEDRADILSYFDKERQIELVKLMSNEDLFRLAKLMESDDLADLLGHIDDEQAKEILDSLDLEESEDVVDLMGYPEDSAGGIMSSDYFAIEQNFTVEQTIRAIQDEQDNSTILFYLYIVNENEQLIGVLSLKQLLLSPPQLTLKEIMQPDVITVSAGADQEDVAKTVERYDFLSLPVVDSNNKLVGVVTVDDVIDVIREEAEEDLLLMNQAGLDSKASIFEQFKARIPWLLVSFVGGIFCFLILEYYLAEYNIIEDSSLLLLVSMVPLILTLGTSAGNQAATTTIGALRAGRFESSSPLEHLRKEWVLAAFFAVLFAALIFGITSVVYETNKVIQVSVAVGIQMFVSIFLGSTIPFLVDKLNLNPTVLAVPLFTIIADIGALFILFSLY